MYRQNLKAHKTTTKGEGKQKKELPGVSYLLYLDSLKG